MRNIDALMFCCILLNAEVRKSIGRGIVRELIIVSECPGTALLLVLGSCCSVLYRTFRSERYTEHTPRAAIIY
jgi:hypothetical protein